jgi:hypothetical protein
VGGAVLVAGCVAVGVAGAVVEGVVDGAAFVGAGWSGTAVFALAGGAVTGAGAFGKA